MQDRNVQYPARYRLVPVPGTQDIFDLEPVPGEILDEGTPINKATLLHDETANRIGFSPEDNPTINDVLGRVAAVLDVSVHTIAPSDWSSNLTYDIPVSAVSADESKQLIMVIPNIESQTSYQESSVRATNQSEGIITISCSALPQVELVIYTVVFCL